MLSRGKFRYIRSVYRSLESKRRFNELFGTPATFTITDLSNLILDPIDPDKLLHVYPFERDVSKRIADTMGLPAYFLTTEKGPENNVTYL